MRQLRVLIEQLPPNNARERHIKGHSWTDLEYLLAITADRIGENTAATVKVAGGKSRAPKPLPRPGKPDNRIGSRGDASVEDVVAYLDSLSSGA
ncbi:hypothetical protein PV646_28825 [Streptomyces sp. ID05-26A]|nr:hypothetical protein [Streptomyces sp. ID05-26A]